MAWTQTIARIGHAPATLFALCILLGTFGAGWLIAGLIIDYVNSGIVLGLVELGPGLAAVMLANIFLVISTHITGPTHQRYTVQ